LAVRRLPSRDLNCRYFAFFSAVFDVELVCSS